MRNQWTDRSARVNGRFAWKLFAYSAVIFATMQFVRTRSGISRALAAIAQGFGGGAAVLLFFSVVYLILWAIDRHRDRPVTTDDSN